MEIIFDAFFLFASHNQSLVRFYRHSSTCSYPFLWTPKRHRFLEIQETRSVQSQFAFPVLFPLCSRRQSHWTPSLTGAWEGGAGLCFPASFLPATAFRVCLQTSLSLKFFSCSPLSTPIVSVPPLQIWQIFFFG